MFDLKLRLDELATKSYVEVVAAEFGTGLPMMVSDFDHRAYAKLLIRDIMTVVAAHALSGDTAADVFANLRRLYEEEKSDEPEATTVTDIAPFNMDF